MAISDTNVQILGRGGPQGMFQVLDKVFRALLHTAPGAVAEQGRARQLDMRHDE